MGIRKGKGAVGQTEPGVTLSQPPDVDDVAAEFLIADEDHRASVIAWLDAHGYAREAETLRRDAAHA